MPENPCLRCGACCAHYRVSFYWREADDTPDGTVPLALTEDITPFYRCMRGTNQPTPHCIALTGEPGQDVACSIYARRPSPCREFGVQWRDGWLFYDEDGLARCNAARRAFGLPPLLVERTPGGVTTPPHDVPLPRAG